LDEVESIAHLDPVWLSPDFSGRGTHRGRDFSYLREHVRAFSLDLNVVFVIKLLFNKIIGIK